MALGSDLMLYIVFGVPIAFVALVLLSMGPLGWFTAAFLGIGALVFASLLGGSDGDGPRRSNCPECGSPNPAEAGTCGYCGSSL